MINCETTPQAQRAASPKPPEGAPGVKALNQSHWRAVEELMEGLREGRSILVLSGPEGAGAEAVLREAMTCLPRRLITVEAHRSSGDLGAILAPLESALCPAGDAPAGEEVSDRRISEALERLACEDRGVVYFLDPHEPLTDAALVFLARLAAGGRRLTRERRAQREEAGTPLRGPVGAQVVLAAPPEALSVLRELGDSAMRRAADTPIEIELFDESALRATFRQQTGGVLAPGAVEIALAATGGRHAELERLLSHPSLTAAAQSEGVAGAEGESAVVTAEATAQAAAELGLSMSETLDPAALDARDFAGAPADEHRADCDAAGEGDREEDPELDLAEDGLEDTLQTPLQDPAQELSQDLASDQEEGDALGAPDAGDDVRVADESVATKASADAVAAPADEASAPEAPQHKDATADLDLLDPARDADAADDVGAEDKTDAEAKTDAEQAELEIGDAETAAFDAEHDDEIDQDAIDALDEAALLGALVAAEESLSPEAMETAGEEATPEQPGSAEKVLAALGVRRRPSASERLRLKEPKPARTLGATRRHAVVLASLGACLAAALTATGMGGAALEYGARMAGLEEGGLLYETADALISKDAPDGDESSGALFSGVMEGALSTAERLARGAADSIAPTDGATRRFNDLADDLFATRENLAREEFEEQLAAMTPDQALMRREQMIADALRRAEDHAAAGRYTGPEGANGYEELLAAYRLAPRDPRVRGALAALVKHYENRASEALDEERYQAFHDFNRIADRIRGRRPI